MSKPKTGVFVCHCGSNIGSIVNVPGVVAFAAGLEGVVCAMEHKYMCSDPGQEMIREAIKEHGLDRVVVASCSPLMHEATFRKTCAEAGLNGYLFQMANIREQVSWVTEDKAAATEKAKTVVRAAVQRVAGHTELQVSTKPCTPATLVIGGGVAGIEAALQIASSDTMVHLVEREPSIGGAMAKFDKTFPTLDCAACILTPKMVQAGTHPNITLHTWTEVVELSGYVGNFKVKLHHKARYVDPDTCTGCGACMQKCPQKKIPHAWEQNLSFRRAIYTPFAQAVPNKPIIDPAHCTMLKSGKCGVCAKVCEAGAIRFDEDPAGWFEEIEVGNIVVATGMKTFDPTPMKALGYGRIPDVYTALEFERMCHASGPTEGHVVKKTDGVLTHGGEPPKAVALVHCIGSRDKNYNAHCSRVCCMYSLKYAHLIKEHVPGCEVYDFYIDMRCFGKGYEEFYQRLLEEDVRFVRGKVAEVNDWAIYPEEEGRLVVRVEDTLIGVTRRIPVDMVVLATGLEPAEGAKELAQTLHMSCSNDGFYLERHPKLAPVSTASEGIYVAGCCQGPKDIPDSVAQGAAAAAQAMAMIKRGTVEIEPTTAHVVEDLCSGCQICIPLCPYEAISRDEEKRVAVVEPALCKGCGTCVGACPSGALQQWGFDDTQIYAELEGILANG
ncbi:MAG: CoB--CoM heterodisulfide reductase iron-sulfur subunit A family protein [Pseudomonadota bacterium]